MSGTTIKAGTVVFLASGVGGHPPARWRVVRVRRDAVDLVHVKHPSASAGYQPQTVGRGLVEAAIARGDSE